ncbi:MAG: magnesium transporter [Lachnospiraceae bacterium]|jgi:magnesium transporter|nr:magnesium transporter [Lachnospiraceae bacterium]
MEEDKILEEVRELLETKQYTRLRQKLADMNIADIAAVMGESKEDELLKVFRILPKSMAADVFSYLEVGDQQYIIGFLSDREAANIINNLMADDAVDFLEEMPANMVKKLLANASAETRRDVNHLLRYPEDSAGSIMTVEYVDLKENMTVADAVTRIRQIGVDRETINICYVLDTKRTLVGAVSLHHLLLSGDDSVIGEIMNDNVICLNTLMDQEEVARQFSKYDFIAMPVVDNENRLVGIITVDDVVDILEEETTEDIEKMAAILPTDKPYLKTGILETWKSRIPWLLLLMISATFTSRILMSFERALDAIPILTAFIPMLMDTGGNAGGQSSVTIIRGLSLGELNIRNMPRIWVKEIIVSICCGVTLSAAYFVKLMLFDKVSMAIALVVCITLVITVIVAKTIGCTLPILAKRIGLDPAVMASPFITTIVDALSLIVYFQIAQRLLPF